MNEVTIDKDNFIESLKKKLEKKEYDLYDSFMKDFDELKSNNRLREFIFVVHNYISVMIDNIILNYFVTLEKREEFEDIFAISKFSFSKKLDIVKKSNLIPKEFCRVLSDFNIIRNIAAHNVNWLEKLDELNDLTIRKDKEFLYSSVPLWFMFLSLYLDFSKRNKKEKNQLDEELKVMAKEFGMTMEDMFSF